MLENYHYCRSGSREIFFDAVFAKKYGMTEAIIFNDLYCYITDSLTMKPSHGNDGHGWLEEKGQWWMRFHVDYLFRRFQIIFDEQEHRNAIKNLCDAGLLYIRPSMTDGYYWVRIGEETGEQ